MTEYLTITKQFDAADSNGGSIMVYTPLKYLYNKGQYNKHMQIMSIQLLLSDQSEKMFVTGNDELYVYLSSSSDFNNASDVFGMFHFLQYDTGQQTRETIFNYPVVIDYSNGIDKGLIYTNPQIYMFAKYKSGTSIYERFVKVKIIFNIVTTTQQKAIDLIKKQ